MFFIWKKSLIFLTWIFLFSNLSVLAYNIWKSVQMYTFKKYLKCVLSSLQ